MFSALTSKPRRNLASALEAHLEEPSTIRVDENDPPSAPLRGVVACLTGMAPEQKDQYHAWVEALGGKYSRDFQASRNTHLIAEHPSGDKYQAAVAASILVVKPSWLEDCHAQKCRVDEDLHSWNNNNNNDSKRKSQNQSSLPPSKKLKRQLSTSLQQCLNDPQYLNNSAPNTRFSSCQFYLVGFEDEVQDRTALGRLIRRGMGSIFWGFQEGVTHVIVHDNCSDAIRESISKAKIESFDDTVALVSPFWILECWEKQQLASPHDFPAILEKRKKFTSKANSKKKKEVATIEKVSNLLRGYLFVPLRISNPPTWMVDYDIKELEKTIRSHGGQILSLKLLEALKSDHQNNTATNKEEKQPNRKCHVLCWGGKAGANAQQQFALHPLLSQVQRRNLCEIVTATPNWLQTCVLEQKMVDPAYIPQLFQPQSWPWRRLVLNDEQSKAGSNEKCCKDKDQQDQNAAHPSCKVRISVTGFTGHRRAAMIQAIQAIGANYDDSMRQHITTHLICADRAVKSQHNQKFQKAQEWGIHVVSVDWLYHILQHGSGGGGSKKGNLANGENDGSVDKYSESQFSVISEERHNK